MNRFIDNWMGRFEHSFSVSCRNLLRKLATNSFRNSLRRRHQSRRKWMGYYLFLLLTVVVVSGCGSSTINQSSNSQTDCRSVQHLMGETCIPLNPQRVIVLWESLDTVLSLGVKPAGAIKYEQEDHYLKDESAVIESVGSPGSPNLESIAALNPDLILGAERDQSNYNLLSQIAPTVLAEVDNSGEWKEMLSTYAEALGKTEEAEQVMADYQGRIEEFQVQMGDRLQKTEVSLLNITPQDRFWIYLEGSFSGTIVADAGLPRPSEQTKIKQAFSIEISKELLETADGDVIFVWTSGGNEELAKKTQSNLKELNADPLWSKLNAVQQDKVYQVPYYWFGMGPIAANLILDDLFKYLVDSPSQTAQ